jgi:ferredoxin like protein
MCPAGCYTFNEETRLLSVVYETCLECGTCYVSCAKGAIDWSYPRGGFGVRYRLT